jgi:hypothetical protein
VCAEGGLAEGRSGGAEEGSRRWHLVLDRWGVLMFLFLSLCGWVEGRFGGWRWRWRCGSRQRIWVGGSSEVFGSYKLRFKIAKS